MEQFIEFFKGVDEKVLIMGLSVVLLWTFLKALRGLIHVLLFISIVVVAVNQFPAVKNFFVSLIS